MSRPACAERAQQRRLGRIQTRALEEIPETSGRSGFAVVIEPTKYLVNVKAERRVHGPRHLVDAARISGYANAVDECALRTRRPDELRPYGHSVQTLCDPKLSASLDGQAYVSAFTRS